MPTHASPPSVVRFGVFEVNLAAQQLRKHGLQLKISGQPFEILSLLVEKPGEVVTRERLRAQLWPADTFVDFEHGLNSAVKRLRKVLGDSPENSRYIETIPRVGYRFIAPVEGGEQTHVVEAKSIRGLRSLIFPMASGLLAVIGFTAVLLGLNVYGWRERLFVHAAKPRIESLAVLPLANLSGDPEQEYFADGMTEALIRELGKTNIPRVISRQSVTQYKGSKKPLQEIARELNVDAVLEGTVVRSGDRVRMTVHLDRASPEGQLWASAYDRSVRDILGLQDEIARTVTDEIQVKLTPQERAHLASARPVDPGAHDDYLRGRYLLGLAVVVWNGAQLDSAANRRGTGLGHDLADDKHMSKFTDKGQYSDLDIQAAIGHFKHAIEKDPSYAMAYAGLADAYILLGHPIGGGHPPKETLFDAKAAATKALDLDPSVAEAHFSLAQTLEYEWNWSEAEKEYKLALNLNPNYADAHLEHGRFVQALGRNDEAMTQMNYAMELNPFDIRTKVYVAWVTWASRQYDLALRQFKSLGDDWGLIFAYRQKEMYSEARAALERWKLGHPSLDRDSYVVAVEASILGLEGRKDEAEKLIDELREMARHQYVSGCLFAEAYVGLGQRGEAITWLERAYEDHDQSMVYIAAYPGFDPLRSEPRFKALLRRMNFPQ